MIYGWTPTRFQYGLSYTIKISESCKSYGQFMKYGDYYGQEEGDLGSDFMVSEIRMVGIDLEKPYFVNV